MTPMMNVPSGQNIQLTDVRGVKTDTDNLLIINRSLIVGPPMCKTETGARFFSFSEHQEFLSFVCSFTLLCLCGGHFCPWPAPTCSPCCSVGDGGGQWVQVFSPARSSASAGDARQGSAATLCVTRFSWAVLQLNKHPRTQI